MNLLSSAGSRFSNSALVQLSRTSPPPPPPTTRSSGTSRLGPCRKPGSTTRWVSALAMGSTTTRLTLPTAPSLQLTWAPIVNSAVPAITDLFLSSGPYRVPGAPLVTLRSPGVRRQRVAGLRLSLLRSDSAGRREYLASTGGEERSGVVRLFGEGMSNELAGKRIAFLVANVGVEQVELTSPWQGGGGGGGGGGGA